VADVLSAAHFRDEKAARKFLEGLRWPNGPVCPHCGSIKKAYAISKPGKYRCAEKKSCRKDFTVTTKTVIHSSRIPLHKWLQCLYFMTTSKKNFSAYQLQRAIKISYKSAWFMRHRVREAMRAGGLAQNVRGVMEIEKTLVGRRKNMPLRTRYLHLLRIVIDADKHRPRPQVAVRFYRRDASSLPLSSQLPSRGNHV
jgi:transposase-like protein